MGLAIKYYPAGSGGPEAYISGQAQAQAAGLYTWIETFAATYPGEWKSLKAKKVTDHVWQHNKGPHRVLFFMQGGNLVVVHAFRKPSQREERKAYELAEKRYEECVGSL
jgi:arabinogalactan endo-1,4-beta-galactosidase